jgi:hypothetical protein
VSEQSLSHIDEKCESFQRLMFSQLIIFRCQYEGVPGSGGARWPPLQSPVKINVSPLLSPELSVVKRKKSGNTTSKGQSRVRVVSAKRRRKVKKASQVRDRALIAKGGAVPEMFLIRPEVAEDAQVAWPDEDRC